MSFENPLLPVLKYAVMASGNGSNFQAVLDACASGRLAASVSLLVTDNPEAGAITRARNSGIPCLILPKNPGMKRKEYDRLLARAVSAFTPDYVLLLGWMRLLDPVFLAEFPMRVINIHPALPGAFPGVHAIDRAWKARMEGKIRSSGVMVHFVPDEGVDTGPVILSQEISMPEGETLPGFESRVHEVEHSLLVRALSTLS